MTDLYRRKANYMKVGIITMFYKSINYGGVLQAYALTKHLNNLDGIDARQICYERVPERHTAKRILKVFNIVKLFRYVKSKINGILNKKSRQYVLDSLSKKSAPFRSFAEKYVPKTNDIYTQHTIASCVDDFDTFIVGSDQVWNVKFYDEVYRMEFVPEKKFKMSYAAGVSSASLTKDQQNQFRDSLKSYKAISVREKDAVATLSPLTNLQVEWVLDPTLLLTSKEWDEICAERKIKEKYVFCYFLGKLSLPSAQIMEFASKRNLKVVTLPFLTWNDSLDSDFGDYKIYDADPADFISLIKHAEFVFTDSFHATVFSHLYQKNFFIFNRAEFKEMSDRIYSLTSLFDTRDRFCDTDEKISLDYIENLSPVNYEKGFPKFDSMKEKSINFLAESLKKAEEYKNGNK